MLLSAACGAVVKIGIVFDGVVLPFGFRFEKTVAAISRRFGMISARKWHVFMRIFCFLSKRLGTLGCSNDIVTVPQCAIYFSF